MSEKNIQSEIMVAATRAGARVWRNNVGNGVLGQIMKQEGGKFIIQNGRRVQFGLCPGSSDLIGIRPVVVQQADVGKTHGLFVALEVKTPTGKATDEQIRFIVAVRKAGGLSGIVCSPDDVIAILNPLL